MGNRPRTKALKAEQLKGELRGDLAAYEQFGLFQRAVNPNTAYRYRGALLRYQVFLGDNPPSLASTNAYLSELRKNEFDPATLRVYRAALAGYHQWRGEELKFKVKVPESSAKYVPWESVQRMLVLAADKPHDELILRLMSDAGLRRDEVVNLKLSSIEGSRLRFRGKGDKQRTVPMTPELQALVDQFAAGREPTESLVDLGEKGVYLLAKRYGKLAGRPEITPHDLRRAFGTHLMDITGNIRIVQQILGHSNVSTTQAYTAVTLSNMETAISKLNPGSSYVKTAGDNPAGVQKEAASRPEIYVETAHKRNMRRLARSLAEKISPPSIWDSELVRQLPLEHLPGRYPLPFGVIEIDKANHVKIQPADIARELAEAHLVGGLYAHLNSSGPGLAALTGEDGMLTTWFAKTGNHLKAAMGLLEGLRTAATRGGIGFSTDEVTPGLTRWFIITVLRDALAKLNGLSPSDESCYVSNEPVDAGGLWQLKCGASIIVLAENNNALNRYKELHKALRLKCAEDKLTRYYLTASRGLEAYKQDIKQRLIKFSDMEHLPGYCELCRNRPIEVNGTAE